MEIRFLDTDRFYYDSPNEGEKDCVCSRCHQHIPEGQKAWRTAIDQNTMVARNKTTGEETRLTEHVNGLEFRLCEKCQVKAGIVHGRSN